MMDIQAKATKLQNDFKTETVKVQELAEQIQELQQKLARVQTQIAECQMVKNELDLASEGDNVWKLVGPVLIKQEHFDAKQTVTDRLNYLVSDKQSIETEISKVQDKTTAARDAIEKILKEFQNLQQQSQQAQQAAAQQQQAAAAKAPAKGGKKGK